MPLNPFMDKRVDSGERKSLLNQAARIVLHSCGMEDKVALWANAPHRLTVEDLKEIGFVLASSRTADGTQRKRLEMNPGLAQFQVSRRYLADGEL